MKPDWTDRRRILYIILAFTLGINIYGGVFHWDASETSLITRICVSSLETMSLIFSGYVLGRLAERHPALRNKDDSIRTDSVDSTEKVDDKLS